MPPKKKAAASKGDKKKDKEHKDKDKKHTKKKKKSAHTEATHDEVEDLFPPLAIKYPLDPADLETNPENPLSFFHNVHENDDLRHIDFHQPEITFFHQGGEIGTPGGLWKTHHHFKIAKVHGAPTDSAIDHDLPQGHTDLVPTYDGVGGNTALSTIPFATVVHKQSSYDPYLWRYQPEWIEWSTKNSRDLSRLSPPNTLPYDLTRLDRRSISRCFAIIRQSYKPIPLPSVLPPNSNHNMDRAASTFTGAPPVLTSGSKPNTPDRGNQVQADLAAALADAANPDAAANPEANNNDGGDGAPAELPAAASPKPRGNRRGRRENSVGRPLRNVPPPDALANLPGVDMLSIFSFLARKGEKFDPGNMLNDTTKSTFLRHLIRSHFPSLPNGELSIELKSIDAARAKKLSKTLPTQDIAKVKYLLDRCETELKTLTVEAQEDGHEVDEAHKEEIMTRKIKHMDELQSTNQKMTLHEACTLGNIDVVADILAPDKAPDLVDLPDKSASGNSMTPLFIAIKNNHLHLVRYMLAACKADPNFVGVGGNTPLHEAALTGNKDMVTLLLNNGADPASANFYGETALHFAARVPTEDNVESLLVYGAHVDAVTSMGKYTPLMFAAGAGLVENIIHLIDHHAAKDLRNVHYQNAIMRAHAAGHEDVIPTLVNHEPGEAGKKKKKVVKGKDAKSTKKTTKKKK